MGESLPEIPGITCDFPRPDGFARPDWERVYEWVDSLETDEKRREAFAAIELKWAEELAVSISRETYALHTEHVIIVASLPPEEINRLLWMCELTNSWLVDLLGPIPKELAGRHFIVHFSDEEEFHAYLLPDEPDGRVALRVYQNQNWSYFILPPETSHYELCHNLASAIVNGFTSNREFPYWVSVGLVRVAARRMNNDANLALFESDPRSLLAVSTPDAIQRFWSGEEFSCDPALCNFSADRLSDLLVREILKFDGQTRPFLDTVKWQDAGESAAREHLGVSLAELVANILGPGDWAPRPEAWPPWESEAAAGD